jgi:hypothetical protein
MKNIKDYKKRFYNLLESTVGNVKPLLESTEPTINKDTATEMERISEFGSTFLKGGFSKVDKGHKFVFIIYSDFTIIHHLGQAGVDRVTIHHQK